MSAASRPRPAIDWQQVRDRLARAAAATEGGLSPQRARALLDERAEVLARVPAAEPHATEVLEVLTFRLAGEDYAIEAEHVREVVGLTDWTAVPGAPAFLVGVANLRGAILALFDLGVFLGTADAPRAEHGRLLVLGDERPEFGVLTDAVDEVRTLRHDEILAPPETVGPAGRPYLRGVTRDALMVLDGAVLLQERRLFIDASDETR